MPHNPRYSVRLPLEEGRLLKALARRERVSMAEIMRRAVGQMLASPRQKFDSDDVLAPHQAKRLRASLTQMRQGKTNPLTIKHKKTDYHDQLHDAGILS